MAATTTRYVGMSNLPAGVPNVDNDVYGNDHWSPIGGETPSKKRGSEMMSGSFIQLSSDQDVKRDDVVDEGDKKYVSANTGSHGKKAKR